jgi:hypothetical protein
MGIEAQIPEIKTLGGSTPRSVDDHSGLIAKSFPDVSMISTYTNSTIIVSIFHSILSRHLYHSYVSYDDFRKQAQ